MSVTFPPNPMTQTEMILCMIDFKKEIKVLVGVNE